MAYFERDTDGNVMYSFYNVAGMIESKDATPERIEEYISKKVFYDSVGFSFDNIDLHSVKGMEQFEKKYKKTAAWLRNKVNGVS